MPSMMSWLDQSAEQQRRVRELVRLFAETDSRDELGIGQIRDVYSSRLFPGMSVIHTRARYFLFVPWLFQIHEARGRSGADLLRRVQASERNLIPALSAARNTDGSPADVSGLIGSYAGARVKILPSATYWGGLTQLGILTRPCAADELSPVVTSARRDPYAADEAAWRARSNWHPTMPAPPDGFPGEVAGGFLLRPEEGAWLRDVILEAAPATLLAHLVTRAEPPLPATAAPWDEPSVRLADPALQRLLDEARIFSLVIHGAALVYNLLLARAYNTAGFNRVTGAEERYEERILRWSTDFEAERHVVNRWDLDRWFVEMRSFNNRIGPATQRFVTRWIEVLRSSPNRYLGTNREAQTLIATRERQWKKSQSRLVNDRLLGNWNGASGADRLTFRWPTVRQLVTDILGSQGHTDAPS